MKKLESDTLEYSFYLILYCAVYDYKRNMNNLGITITKDLNNIQVYENFANVVNLLYPELQNKQFISIIKSLENGGYIKIEENEYFGKIIRLLYPDKKLINRIIAKIKESEQTNQ